MKVRRILIPLALLVGIGSGIFFLGKQNRSCVEPPKRGSLDRGNNTPKLPEITNLPHISPPSSFPLVKPTTPIAGPNIVKKSEIDISERFKRLEELAGRDVIELDGVDLFPSPENLTFDPNGYGCTRIETPTGKSEYIDAWMPKSIIDMTLARGEEFNENLVTLYGVFPAQRNDIYWEATDSMGGISYGKTSMRYSEKTKSYLYNFVWNNGVEEFYINRDGFMYPTNEHGFLISEIPIWHFNTESEDGGSYYHEEMILLSNPKFKLILGSNVGAYEFFIRLRSSCPGGDMLPRFLRITQDNFADFVRKAYGKN